MRMTAAQKAEYDQYMQNLLKTRGFNPGPTLQISQDDNNPFSDGFQTKLQFEQQEKMRQQMMGSGQGGGGGGPGGPAMPADAASTASTAAATIGTTVNHCIRGIRTRNCM